MALHPADARRRRRHAWRAPVVSAALTETNVRVNSDFRGDQIVLYGAVFDPAVAAQRRGGHRARARPAGADRPQEPKIAGLWINSRPVVFQGAPGFYIAASTRRSTTSPASASCAGWRPASTTWR